MQSLWRWVKGSIQRKLMLTYVLLIAFPLGLTAILMYKASTDIVTEQTEKNNYKMLQLMNVEIDRFIEEINRIGYFVYLDHVQMMLNQVPDDPIGHSSWQLRLSSQMNYWTGFLGFKGGIRGFALFDEDGLYFKNEGLAVLDRGQSVRNAEWYRDALSLEGKQIMPSVQSLQSHLSLQPIRKDSLHFVVARKVHNLVGTKKLGVLVAEIELFDMDRILLDMGMGDSTGLIIINQTKEILYKNGIDETKVNVDDMLSPLDVGCGGVLQGEGFLVNSFQSATTNWCYVTITDADIVSAEAKKLSVSIAWVGVLGFSVALLISGLFARRIVLPIKRLQTSMKNIEKHNFKTQIPIHNSDEVGALTETFNAMVVHIRQLIHTVYHAEIREKEANLNALQSQINPHFLYNTLDTINAMAVVEEKEDISRMVVALGEMFRYALNKKDELVTVNDELLHLHHYVTIQRCRYEDRIRFAVDIPENILHCSIIPLVLQPLVENAISHGLEPLSEGGTVHIQGVLVQDTVRISIVDDGIGMTGERLKQLRSRLTYPVHDLEENMRKSIGLFNVNERIKLYFGKAYGLELKSERGAGTSVTVVIPAPI